MPPAPLPVHRVGGPWGRRGGEKKSFHKIFRSCVPEAIVTGNVEASSAKTGREAAENSARAPGYACAGEQEGATVIPIGPQRREVEREGGGEIEGVQRQAFDFVSDDAAGTDGERLWVACRAAPRPTATGIHRKTAGYRRQVFRLISSASMLARQARAEICGRSQRTYTSILRSHMPMEAR